MRITWNDVFKALSPMSGPKRILNKCQPVIGMVLAIAMGGGGSGEF